MIDLVLTHLNQPWGPPRTLETLGDPWWHLATLGDHAWKWPFWPFWPFSGMVAKGCQGSPRVSKVQGGTQGWLRWVRTKSIIFKSFSNMILKKGPFPHWNPHSNRKVTVHTQLWVYNSENRFLGSFYHNTCRVKRVKRLNEKSVFGTGRLPI